MRPDWNGHVLHKNRLLKHITEGKIEGEMEMTGRHGRRHKQLLDEFKKTRGYWKFTEKAPDCTMLRSCFGRGYRTLVRQAPE
jgi:hypothetical protein